MLVIWMPKQSNVRGLKRSADLKSLILKQSAKCCLYRGCDRLSSSVSMQKWSAIHAR